MDEGFDFSLVIWLVILAVSFLYSMFAKSNKNAKEHTVEKEINAEEEDWLEILKESLKNVDPEDVPKNKGDTVFGEVDKTPRSPVQEGSTVWKQTSDSEFVVPKPNVILADQNMGRKLVEEEKELSAYHTEGPADLFAERSGQPSQNLHQGGRRKDWSKLKATAKPICVVAEDEQPAEFDLRRAIIYSEILKTKFEE